MLAEPPVANPQARLNRLAYESVHRARLERSDMGRVALMHERDVVDVFDDWTAASHAGRERYGSNNYSIVEIGAKPVSLGWFSAALG